MKLITDIVLLAAAFGSVFFVANLAGVTRSVRWSVTAIGPAFLLTFLLHIRSPQHVDYGLSAVSVALIASAVTGFRFTQSAPLSREHRLQLIKRFAILFGLSAVAVGVVATLIIMVGETKGRDAPQASTVTRPDTAQRVHSSPSTQSAIDSFKRLAQ